MMSLCKLGFHKADKFRYMVVKRQHWPSKKWYTRNYAICARCGKRITPPIQMRRVNWKESKK